MCGGMDDALGGDAAFTFLDDGALNGDDEEDPMLTDVLTFDQP